MANSNDPKNPGKKIDSAAAQKMREQLANKVAELTDDELNQVAGGTTEITLPVLSITTLAVPFGPPSGGPISPGQVLPTAG
jgi:bacteriocin-like protein